MAQPAPPAAAQTSPQPAIAAGAQTHQNLREALNAAHDLQSALKVGVTDEEYRQHLVKATQIVDRCVRQASGEEAKSGAWSELAAAMADYEFGNYIAQFGRRNRGLIHDNQAAIKMIASRYPSCEFLWSPPNPAAGADKGYWYTSVELVRLAAWASADAHLRKADAFLQR